MKFHSPQDSDNSSVNFYHLSSPVLFVNANEYERILYHKAIELLARRDHSEFELRQKFKTLKQQPQESVATEQLLTKVMTKIQQQGLQSDERFAASYCRSRLRKGFGEQRICMELAQKGIEKSLAE